MEILVDHPQRIAEDAADEERLSGGETLGEERVEKSEAEADGVLEFEVDVVRGFDKALDLVSHVHLAWCFGLFGIVEIDVLSRLKLPPRQYQGAIRNTY